MRKRPDYLTATVRLGGRRLVAEYRLHRGRSAPHVGADSPRFLDPGEPDRVEVLRLLLGRVDVTDHMTSEDVQAAEYQIARERKTGGAPSQSPAAGDPAISFGPPVSFRHDTALAIGERVLAKRERRVRESREQGRLL